MIKNIDINNELEHISEKLEKTIKHQEREAIFATEANERFEKNWQCFTHYYPEIVAALSKLQLRDDFCIHVTQSGHGNIIPKNALAPLYSQNPLEQSQEQVRRQIEHPVFSLTDYTGYPDSSSDKRLHTEYMVKLGQFMRKLREYDEKKIAQLPCHFPSGIIFGVGLGYHIPELLNHTEFDYLFIIEPDIEQFYASLFCIDWFDVIKKIDDQGNCLFFNLGADKNTFIQGLENVVEDIGAFSAVRSFCYQHTPGREINELIANWAADYFRFQMGHGFFNDAITGFAHSIAHIESNQSFLTNKASLPASLLDIPVFIIGNGPSLDEAVEYLKNNQNKGIVVAAGSAIVSLERLGIQADFHVLVERPYANYKIVADSLPNEAYKRVNLLAVNMVHPKTTELYKWSGLALKGNEGGTDFINFLSLKNRSKTLPLIPYSNPLVSNTALSLFLNFGFKNVYLFGVDNGSLPTGKHHSDHSFYKKDKDDEKGISCAPVTEKTLPGNLSDSFVYTNDLYKVSHSQIEKLLEIFPAVDVFNIGNGAKIKGAISLAADILIDPENSLDKPPLLELIKTRYFENLNLDKLNDEDYEIQRFIDMCDHLLVISNEPYTTIKEAADLLKRQQRYVYSFKNSPLGHIYHMMKGSLLYYHCPLITLLYSYENETFTLEQFDELFLLWQNYIVDMRDYFEDNYKKPCDFLNDQQLKIMNQGS